MNKQMLQKGAIYGDNMERKYLKNLIEWMNDEEKKPLLVTGARQVGKTYLMKLIYIMKYVESIIFEKVFMN